MENMNKAAVIVLVIVIVLVVIALAFLIALIVIRNKLVNQTEEIKRAKSEVRVSKARYYSHLQKVEEMSERLYYTEGESKAKLGKISNISSLTGVAIHGDNSMGTLHDIDDDFSKASSFISKLEYEYRSKQNLLNSLVSAYNKYIKNFPIMIFAAILRYKPMEYVDEDNLDLATKLNIEDEGIA